MSLVLGEPRFERKRARPIVESERVTDPGGESALRPSS